MQCFLCFLSHSHCARKAFLPGPTGSAAPPEYTPLSFADEPLSYVVYHDARSGADAYIGLLYSGGNKLVIRVYENDSNKVLLVSQTFYTTPERANGATSDPSVNSAKGATGVNSAKGATGVNSAKGATGVNSAKGATGVNSANADKPLLYVEPGTINILSGDVGASPYGGKILSEIYGWIDAWLHSRDRFDEASDYDFDETYRYRFEYWIPILRMRAADVRGDAPAGKIADDVELVTAGVVESMTDPAFFSFDGEIQTAKGPSYAIASGKPLPAIIDALEIPLDSNWVRGADGAYRISRESPQDAFCRVDTLDVSEFGTADTFDLIKLFILYSGGILMPEDLRIFVSGGYPCLFYRVCDPVTHKVTAQYRLFIPKDETHLSVLSFGAFESLYESNKEYFDSMLF